MTDRTPGPRPASHRVLSLRERLEGGAGDGETDRGAVTPDELAAVFGAPWRRIELVRQAAGTATERRLLNDCDLLLFVVSGEGSADCSSGEVDLTPGTSLAILKGEEYSLAAGPAGIELFCAEMEVPE